MLRHLAIAFALLAAPVAAQDADEDFAQRAEAWARENGWQSPGNKEETLDYAIMLSMELVACGMAHMTGTDYALPEIAPLELDD